MKIGFCLPFLSNFREFRDHFHYIQFNCALKLHTIVCHFHQFKHHENFSARWNKHKKPLKTINFFHKKVCVLLIKTWNRLNFTQLASKYTMRQFVFFLFSRQNTHRNLSTTKQFRNKKKLIFLVHGLLNKLRSKEKILSIAKWNLDPYLKRTS